MKESLEHHSVEDRIEPAPETPALNLTELSGSWVNTEATPIAISRAVIEARAGAVYVQTVGTDLNGTSNRNEAKADRCYAASPSGCDAVGLTASCESALGKVELHANISKGLLIITSIARRGWASPRLQRVCP